MCNMDTGPAAFNTTSVFSQTWPLPKWLDIMVFLNMSIIESLLKLGFTTRIGSRTFSQGRFNSPQQEVAQMKEEKNVHIKGKIIRAQSILPSSKVWLKEIVNRFFNYSQKNGGLQWDKESSRIPPGSSIYTNLLEF